MPTQSKRNDDATDLKNRAQRCMLQLRQSGLTPKDIEVKLGGLISWRTLYRWMNGEITPKRPYDVIALEKLLRKDKSHK
jgi:hypothetical protein